MDPQDTRRQLAEAQQAADALQRQLNQQVANCQHDWGEVQYRYVVLSKAYTIPADPPGVGGVDRRHSPIHVPEKGAREWYRTCKKCGHVQTTRKTKPKTVASPYPGAPGGTVQVPHFEDKPYGRPIHSGNY